MNQFHDKDFLALSEFFTLDQVASHLHISNSTLRNKLSKGENLPENFKVGRRRLFPKESFFIWLEEKRQSALQGEI